MVYGDILPVHGNTGFEVDSTESIWYTAMRGHEFSSRVLKLTPQSQYGIKTLGTELAPESVLKLTPQSQYGIPRLLSFPAFGTF